MRTGLVLALMLVLAAGCAEDPPRTMTFSVEGMTCESCVKAIEVAVGNVEGVVSVEVDLETKTAVIVVEGGTSTETVLAAVPGDYTLTPKRP